jgi:hypothetical protein
LANLAGWQALRLRCRSRSAMMSSVDHDELLLLQQLDHLLAVTVTQSGDADHTAIDELGDPLSGRLVAAGAENDAAENENGCCG